MKADGSLTSSGLTTGSCHESHDMSRANPYSTKKCTILLLCISVLISSYMFGLNDHQHGAKAYIAKT